MPTTIQLLIVEIMQQTVQPAPPTCKLRRVDSLAVWLPGDRLALQDGRKEEKSIAQETSSTTIRSAAI